ncbi:MAG: CDP-diacylglycerol--glycerol-3-phosphate 3-phosphatidyltransferase [Bacilli bacterium]|nr:CDP-diacylglycerol--glycerol-3-phosphate 3-phosphatidyltransferase [Bacilli bacterium]
MNKNVPNILTACRIGMAFAIIFVMLFIAPLPNVQSWVIGSGSYTIPGVQLIIFFVFVLASVTDFFDGYLARKYNLVSTLGKFLDPIADKILINSLLILFVLPTTSPAFGFVGATGVPMVCVVIMICRDLIVDVLRMVAMGKGQVIAASWWGKIKTVTQMVAIGLVILNNWPFAYLNLPVNITNIICGVAAFASLMSGIIYVYNGRHLFKSDEVSSK